MSPLSENSFVRRVNANGTTHSICTRCFVTVVTATCEADLDQAELNHVCDSWLVAHWKELAERDPSEGWDRTQPHCH